MVGVLSGGAIELGRGVRRRVLASFLGGDGIA